MYVTQHGYQQFFNSIIHMPSNSEPLYAGLINRFLHNKIVINNVMHRLIHKIKKSVTFRRG